MFATLSRSWELTKTSFRVLAQDKELLLFPVLGGFFSLLFLIAMIFPMIISGLTVALFGEALGGLVDIVVVFCVYLGLSCIATFFNVCAVFTIKTRFEGGNASFMQSILFAVSKIHLIIAWGIVAATVGVILHLLTNLASRLGIVGQIIMNIFISLLGGIWGIITIFVVPAMVYENVGPLSAIRFSVETLKKTWGESLIRALGLGLAQALLFLVFFIVGIVLIVIAGIILPLLGLVLFFVWILALLLLVLIFSLANTIFNTALFVYARTGKVPTGYSEEVLKSAFKQKEPKKSIF